MRPNNSFKPNPLRSTNNMAEEACHVVGSTTQVGLTQALGPMGKFHADLTDLLERCRSALLEASPSVVEHSNLDNLRENQLPESLVASPFNLYAIWSRQKGTAIWALQYIGQRSVKESFGRIRQHLFHTPAGTWSKFRFVQEALRTGHELGVTAILVEPDYLRLSIEDELIRQTTTEAGTLPWNIKSRAKILGNGP